MASRVRSLPSVPLRGLLKVTRFWNLLIIVLAQYFTAIFLAHGARNIPEILVSERLFLLSLSSVFIAAAGYVINDYYDVKIDLINKPKRVVVGKGLTRRVAMFIHVVFSISGVLIGMLISWKIGVVNLFCAGLLWLYSNQLKRLPFIGNLAVALLTGISIYVIHLILPEGKMLVLTYALFAFYFTLIREVIKDMEDVKGDATFGCRTLPVIYGLRKTKYFIHGLTLLFLFVVFFLSSILIGPRLVYFSLILIFPLAYLAYRLFKADTVREFNYLSQYCKVVMLLGILSMSVFYIT